MTHVNHPLLAVGAQQPCNSDNLLEWKENIITDSILQLIARLSSKVFLGDELCRNEAWLETSKNYTVLAAGFARMTSFLPRPLKQARDILAPILENRNQAEAEAKRKGKPAPVYNDMLDNPRHVEDLRKEIIEVLTADGLSKAALSNLKLMDSALKETQRLTPVSYLSMKRIAAEKVTLADGTVINKGDYTVVNGKNMADPPIWPESESPDHMGFGHEDQACPGCFFAANELKIAMYVTPLQEFAEAITIDPNNKVRFRRRQEELDPESLFSK
ncbi:cytochrome P450 [Bipolaris maydis]|nr:cytochrome P450 [Bipolaris maydis]